MMTKILITLPLLFATAAVAETPVRDIETVMRETGRDALDFACAHDGRVILNKQRQSDVVVKVCAANDSIEFSCVKPSGESRMQQNDADCAQRT